MNFFIGDYTCKLDAKGRISVPAGLMKQFPADFNKTVVIKKNVYQKCLELYTIDSWKETMKKLYEKHSFEEDYEEFVRDYTDGNTPVEIDGSNRILVSKHLLEYADMKKEVLLKSAVDKIEIWGVEAYEDYRKNFDKKRFADKAKQVMGRKSGE